MSYLKGSVRPVFAEANQGSHWPPRTTGFFRFDDTGTNPKKSQALPETSKVICFRAELV
jgi:hypothetical protein